MLQPDDKLHGKTNGRLLLILVGLPVTVFSQEIVFPGLERLVGIETIVGSENEMGFMTPDHGRGER